MYKNKGENEMSFKRDREMYLSIANNPNLSLQQKTACLAQEFYQREKNFNMKEVEKLARWINKETGLDTSGEQLWAIISRL